MNEKEILIDQIIVDLESAKKVVDEQGFIGQDEFDRIINKVRKVKEINDAEIEPAEKDDAFDPDEKDWPEAHGARDTESGAEV